MAWRKWIVRGVVYGIIGACIAGALAYQRWTNPSAVREQIIAQLGKLFPGAQVSVDSARLRILGGIELTGLRLMRADDPEKHEFLFVPSAIFYHDKEKILEGELTLRKIELHHPRLRVRRERSGKWNLDGVIKKPSAPQNVLPTIVVHQGTIVFEDRADPAKAATLDINDISLTMINDPLPTVTIRGAANSDWLGKLQMKGQFSRLDCEAYLTFNASQIPLTQALVARFPNQFPGLLLSGLELDAGAAIRGQVSYHPAQAQPLYYDVYCEIDQGTVKHPKLPLPLDRLQAKIHCHNGEVRVEKLTARSGMTEIEAEGQALLPRVDQNFEAQIDLRHVELGPDLASRLPDKIRNLHTLFKPNGPTTIHIDIAQRDGKLAPLTNGDPSQVSLRPEGVSLEFEKFPYPLERAEGTVDYNILNEHVSVDLKAFAGDRPVILKGDWIGDGPHADVRFDIIGDDVPIDEKLFLALQRESLSLRQFSESFHPVGKINVRAYIRHEPGHKKFRNVFHVYVHDADIRWDNFPYALKEVSGFLNIYPDHWEFKEFHGRHHDGHVLVHGQSTPKRDRGEDAHGIYLEIAGRDIVLDDDLREALKPMRDFHKTWETFAPEGKLNFEASISRPSGDIKDLDVQVRARGCTIKPVFFPYRVQEVAGEFRFTQHRLEIAKLRARHDQALIAMDQGIVDLSPHGGYYADLRDIRVQGMRFDEEFMEALPSKQGLDLRKAARALHLENPLEVKTQVVIKQPKETGMPPDVYWNCQLWMNDAKFMTGMEFTHVTGTLACIGRHNGRQIEGINGHLQLDQAKLFGQPFQNVHAKFQISDKASDVLLIGLHAPIFGGDVTGQMRVDLKSTIGYEMNLTASQIDVAEFGKHNLGPKSQLSGTASARLSLKGLGIDNGVDSLDGTGSIDIPHGHFYNLPFLLDLLKFLGLHWPDRTAFEEFHTAYGIQGSQVTMHRFDLLGSAISLSGKGDYDLKTKKLQLDIYPMWGRIEQLLPPMVRPFPTTFSKNLLTVEVRGKLGTDGKDVKYHMKPLPVIFDPLLLGWDRLRGQSSGPGAVGSNEAPVPVRAERKQ